MKIIFILTLVFLAACSSTKVKPGTHFFRGTVQRSSFDGQTNYGPAFNSIISRKIDGKSGKITECVFQEDKFFIYYITPSADPLVFDVKDQAETIQGKLIFEDKSLKAWSYDVQVAKPKQGRITGYLNDKNGARIDPKTGHLTITKLWNKQMRMTEAYVPMNREEYLEFLTSVNTFAELTDCK